MPIGLLLYDWDNQQGSQLRYKSPQNLSVSNKEILKILMSHSMDEIHKTEVIEIHIRKRVFLSYCNKTKLTSTGYNMLILILLEEEFQKFENYKILMQKKGEKIISSPPINRRTLFFTFANEIFQKRYARKLLFVGPASVGKTSIKKMFFDEIPSDQLLDTPLEPTYGVHYFSYEWLDLELGVADVTGQELENYLNKIPETDLNPFDEVDSIIYIFDPEIWKIQNTIILNQIHTIYQKFCKNNELTKLYLFLHKSDLLNSDERDEYFSNIEKILIPALHNRLFLTSIRKDLNFSVFNALQQIIESISIKTKIYSDKIREILFSYSNTAVVFMNHDRIIFTVFTDDFIELNLPMIQRMIKSIANFYNYYYSNLISFFIDGLPLSMFYSSFNFEDCEDLLIISRKLDMNSIHSLSNIIIKSLSKIVLNSSQS